MEGEFESMSDPISPIPEQWHVGLRQYDDEAIVWDTPIFCAQEHAEAFYGIQKARLDSSTPDWRNYGFHFLVERRA